jgi:hypothetical protein
MKTLSLKLKEGIFDDAERIIEAIRISRNAYINQAVAFYNKLNRRNLLRRKLRAESSAARESSLQVLREFERFEEDLPS